MKTYPTGDAASPDINDHHTLCMTFEEMHAVVATAHNHKLKVTGHCRATEGIKNALRAGYDAVEHATFIDDEGLELLLERDVPVVPGLRFELMSIERGPQFGLSQRVIDGHQETLEGGAESCRRIIEAGGRLGMGGGVEQITDAIAAIRIGARTLGEMRDRASLRWSAECLAKVDAEVLTPVIEGRWLDGYDLAHIAARIRCPVVLLQADPAAGGALTDEDVRAFFTARIERFPGSGHLLHWLHPARVAESVNDFA